MNNRKVLLGLDYTTIMHPDDRKTIEWLNGLKVPYKTAKGFISALARNPSDHSLKEWYDLFKAGLEYYTFQDFLRATISKYREAYNEVENQGDGISITSKSMPHMYQQLVECCRILGVKDIPTYSSEWFYAPFHCSNGEVHRRIIITSGCADLYSDAEMDFVLGHELGHMVCGHKPYHMLLETFYMPFINDPSFKAWASIVKFPLLEWYRISDYTADRMGLLCCQDINVALSTMIKRAGLPKKYYNSISIKGFIQQAKDFDCNFSSLYDKTIKILSVRSAEFPWLVARANQLLSWYESGEYNQILNKYSLLGFHYVKR